MAMFQNSVVNKILQNQDKKLIATKWSVFKNHFQNPAIQKNIRNSKEERYQGEFLIEKFQRNVKRKFNLSGLPKKIQDWHSYTYSDFIKELAKNKVKLSLAEKQIGKCILMLGLKMH